MFNHHALISKRFTVDFFWGVSGWWGIELTYGGGAFTFMFIHWYVGFEVWKNRDS